MACACPHNRILRARRLNKPEGDGRRRMGHFSNRDDWTGTMRWWKAMKGLCDWTGTMRCWRPTKRPCESVTASPASRMPVVMVRPSSLTDERIHALARGKTLPESYLSSRNATLLPILTGGLLTWWREIKGGPTRVRSGTRFDAGAEEGLRTSVYKQRTAGAVELGSSR
ncbi:hypothetical protein BD626DRAFT_515864 [Schizophyllum amplum]|uniref:Uncharacterized protein n=1 Tax=Schizophyllum amplum TaxID=97359 RepID=A0A550BXE6_9AGAR|nr:hypothetical protein BD626DRAFT_515864 [Auriculariopsis ampla]